MTRQLKELERDNGKLQKPLELDTDDKKISDVKQDQKDALEEINKHQGMDESTPNDEKQKAGKMKINVHHWPMMTNWKKWSLY